MADKYTNIGIIMDRIMRHPMLKDIPFETMVDYTVDFIQIVGCPAMFEEKSAILDIHDYRALLPCDFVDMIQVRCRHPEWPQFRRYITYRYATDSFHISTDLRKGTADVHVDLTYKIQGCMIYTSNKEGTIEIMYEAIATDQEGLPMVPDNPVFFRALEGYIKKQHFTMLYDMGKIQGPVLQRASQDYAWAVAQCENEFHRLTLDKAESFFNSWKSLIERDTEHWRGFITNGSKEITPLTALPNIGYGYTNVGPQVIFKKHDGGGDKPTPKPDTVAKPEIHCVNNVVTITCETENAVIYYKISGSEEWLVYNEPIIIGSDTVFESYAQVGENKSETTTYTAKYTEPEEVAPPTYRVANNIVTLSCYTLGASIYYRVSGDETWTKYTTPIPISQTTTFEAFSSLGVDESDIITFTAQYVAPGPVIEKLDYPMFYGGSNTEVVVDDTLPAFIQNLDNSDDFVTSGIYCEGKYYYFIVPSEYNISRIVCPATTEDVTENFPFKSNLIYDDIPYKMYEYHLRSGLSYDEYITITLTK